MRQSVLVDMALEIEAITMCNEPQSLSGTDHDNPKSFI